MVSVSPLYLSSRWSLSRALSVLPLLDAILLRPGYEAEDQVTTAGKTATVPL